MNLVINNESGEYNITAVPCKEFPSGLFSQINRIVTIRHYYKTDNFKVDWINMPFLLNQEKINPFSYLFEQTYTFKKTLPHKEITEWPHFRFTAHNAALLYNSTKAWRFELNKWCLKPRREWLEIARSFISYYRTKNSQIIGVHVRNNKISGEQPTGRMPELEQWFSAIENLKTFKTSSIFLATDNEETLLKFKDKFGDKLIYRNIRRAPDSNTELHLMGDQTKTDMSNALIDALILAHCDKVIHTVSNIATFVLYTNPFLTSYFLTSRHQT